MRATSPLDYKATLYPKAPAEPPARFSTLPCWAQVEPERVKTDAPSPPGLPISAVLPSDDKAMLAPNLPVPVFPASFLPCCVQVEQSAYTPKPRRHLRDLPGSDQRGIAVRG